ncbi:MAG: hypothetical protein V4510_07150 [bacterium]
MAGGILKSFGVVFLILGIVAVVGGLGAAAYGFMQQKDNQDHGLFQDNKKTEENKQVITYGAIGAAAGLAAVIVGIVLLVAGGARRDTQMTRAVGAAAVANANAATAASRSVKGAAAEPASARTAAPATQPSGARRAAIAGILLFALVLVVWAFVAVGGFKGVMSGGASRPPESGPSGILLNETHAGNVQGVSVNGMALNGGGNNGADFTVPAGSTACTVTLNWSPTTGGPTALELQASVGGTLAKEGHGGPGLVMDLRTAGDKFAPGVAYHLAVFPDGDAQVVPPQDFSLAVLCVS